jgi:alpha-tubulin suppressor-like RCC1 family protein
MNAVIGPSSAAGTVWCWGDNVFGQIGNGTAVNNAPQLAPTKVKGQP